MRTSVITNGDTITQNSMSMMSRACNISCQKSCPFKRKYYSLFHKFHCPYFQVAYRMWGPVVASLHQSSQHLHSPPPLCPLTDKIAIPHQNGTRSTHKFPLYYLFTCTLCLYDKQHFIRAHALQLLPWTASPLQMGMISFPKMLVWNYHFMLHYIPEQHRYQNYCPYILHWTLYSTLTWKQGYI